MTKRAGKRYPRVIFASPGRQPPRVRHSASNSVPAARWIAPSTPPPPRSVVFAAFTIASTSSFVMSPRADSILPMIAYSNVILDMLCEVGVAGVLIETKNHHSNTPSLQYSGSPVLMVPAAQSANCHPPGECNESDRAGDSGDPARIRSYLVSLDNRPSAAVAECACRRSV